MSLVNEVIETLSEESESHCEDISDAARQQMNKVLASLMEAGSDFFGATISSVDGIAWAEVLMPGFDKHRFAAMSSSLLAISDELASEVNSGTTNNLLIEAVSGKIVIMHAGPLMLLTVFTKKDATLGMALARAKKATEELEAIQI